MVSPHLMINVPDLKPPPHDFTMKHALATQNGHKPTRSTGDPQVHPRSRVRLNSTQVAMFIAGVLVSRLSLPLILLGVVAFFAYWLFINQQRQQRQQHNHQQFSHRGKHSHGKQLHRTSPKLHQQPVHEEPQRQPLSHNGSPDPPKHGPSSPRHRPEIRNQSTPKSIKHVSKPSFSDSSDDDSEMKPNGRIRTNSSSIDKQYAFRPYG